MTLTNIKDIQTLVSNLVSDKINEGCIVNMQWATKEILDLYSDINGDDVDFYLITARYYIGDVVKRCIKKYEPSTENPNEQLVMDGFEHLQKAYPVDRGDGRAIVPVGLLSDQELEERAAEYEKMAAGCKKHALEIRQYINSRAAVVAV